MHFNVDFDSDGLYEKYLKLVKKKNNKNISKEKFFVYFVLVIGSAYLEVDFQAIYT